MLGSCVETIQPHISTVSSSKEAWERLLILFANKSLSRVMSLKERLLNNPRGTRSIPEYLQQMRAIADDLALVDNPLSEDDLVIYILVGIGPEFKEIDAALRARDTPISFDELYDKLGDYELHLNKDDPTPSLSIATANYTHRHNCTSPQSQSPYGNTTTGRQPGYLPPFGNTSLLGRPPNQQSSHNNGSHTVSRQTNQSRTPIPKSSLYCRFCQGKLQTPHATFTLHDVLCAPSINQNLISVAKFYNSNNVSLEFFPFYFVVKDLRTGAILLRGENVNDVYCLPSPPAPQAYAMVPMKYTLVMAQDLRTGAILLRGENVNDVYCLPSPPAPQAHAISKSSLYDWHQRLGHPSFRHIALDYHFVRKCVTNGTLRVHHVNSKDQLADILTKVIPRQQFHQLQSKIGVTNGASILRGHVKKR
ncbi:hypothetical protein RJ640_029844 [Escallonia rubra]|uniref:GAG-pre-integrase domain-containing protein n=1 Tax=Escallonia rubra TaxID=112253 RepID=A0AA88R470_9ASTE|nr:hypothetical protein RJ640_029844 [Escallonia rubra]